MDNVFQSEADDWVIACFGKPGKDYKRTRALRFLEEALELAQACELTEGDARRVLAYVYARPLGEINNEVGGVMLTLASLATAWNVSLDRAGRAIIAGCWDRIEAIRAKDKTKPRFEP